MTDLTNKHFKHTKSQHIYRVLHVAIDATNCRDGGVVVVYERASMVFVRDIGEFLEKFTEVKP